MTFRSWLQKQRNRNDAVGDFARDVRDDLDSRGIHSVTGWVKYLNNRHACEGAIEAVKKAWKEYSNETQ